MTSVRKYHISQSVKAKETIMKPLALDKESKRNIVLVTLGEF